MNDILDSELDPSDSSAQGLVEVAMLNRFGSRNPHWLRIPWKDAASRLNLPDVWRAAQPDAAWLDGKTIIIAEAYARLDPLASGHRRKIALDVLKLFGIRDAAPPESQLRLFLIFPSELSAHLRGRGWFLEALKALTIAPVEMLDSERRLLRAACDRQATGQARTSAKTKRIR